MYFTLTELLHVYVCVCVIVTRLLEFSKPTLRIAKWDFSFSFNAGLSQHTTVTTLGSSSLTGGSAGTSYYHTDPSSHEHHGGSPAKYHENGHDTFSDFVTLVCQEAQSTGGQVGPCRLLGLSSTVWDKRERPLNTNPFASAFSFRRATLEWAVSSRLTTAAPCSPHHPHHQPPWLDLSPSSALQTWATREWEALLLPPTLRHFLTEMDATLVEEEDPWVLHKEMIRHLLLGLRFQSPGITPWVTSTRSPLDRFTTYKFTLFHSLVCVRIPYLQAILTFGVFVLSLTYSSSATVTSLQRVEWVESSVQRISVCSRPLQGRLRDGGQGQLRSLGGIRPLSIWTKILTTPWSLLWCQDLVSPTLQR